MSEWFYAQGVQRQGPVSAEEIAALFHRGELTVDTLVWTQSMPEWSPLGTVAAELGLGDVPEADAVNSIVPESASPYAAPAAVTAAHVAPVHSGDVVYAGFWKRLAAATIDGFLMAAVSFIVMFVGMLALGGAMAFNAEGVLSDVAQGTLGIGAVLVIYGLPIVIQVIYFTWMHASSSQATLGKMAIGIKVTRGNGEVISLGRSFGRWCAYFVLSLPCGIGTLISAFTSGLSERKQGLHDMMADTLVVDRWAFTAHPERQRHELGVLTWVILALLGLAVVGYFLMIMFAVGLAAMGGAH